MENSTPQSGKNGSSDSGFRQSSGFTPPVDRPPAYRDLVLLGGFCLFLSALDHLIPKPLPFMRIGLANLPLLIALGIFSAKNFFLLALIKVLGQGLITGTLFSYVALFSLTGTALSAALMFVLHRALSYPKNTLNTPAMAVRKKGLSLIGIGIAGAFVSNAAQLVLARFIVFGEGVLYLAPPFLAAGIISGGLLGFFAEKFSAHSEWLRRRRGGGAPGESAAPGENAADSGCAAAPTDAEPAHTTYAVTPSQCAANSSLSLTQRRKDAEAQRKEERKAERSGLSLRSVLLLLLALFFLLVPWLPVRAALFVLFWVLAFAAGKKPRPIFTIIGIVMITACNLFPPFGKILFQIGPVIIAEGSLMRGLQRAVTMEGLIMFSRLALASAFPLPGTLGRLLRETFGILEQLNASGRDKARLKPGSRKEKTGTLLQHLDKLLCEMSGIK